MAYFSRYRRSRRGSYKRRRRYSRPYVPKPRYVKPSLHSRAYQQVQVYLNPWSVATTNPKIPDGKCRLSVGATVQVSDEYVAGSTANQTMECFIFPGLSSGAFWRGVTVGNDALRSMQYSNHVDIQASDPGGTTTDTILLAQPQNNTALRWRLVSQGVRFMLTNNTDENDGWWEAIRLTVPRSATAWRIQKSSDGGPPDSNPEAGIIVPVLASVIPTGTNLVEHPTYRTGKIRAIDKYDFNLVPHDTDHDFNMLYDSIRYISTEDDAVQSTAEQQMVDKSYDCIYVRFHVRSNTAAPTRLMCHLKAHHETMYDSQATLARYHTEADVHPNFDQIAATLMQMSQLAGRLRSRGR